MHLRLLVPLIFSFASAQSELLIGVVQSLSTPLQRTAVSLFNFTVNELNANGSFPIPIRLIIRDSKDSIRGAIVQASDLVKNYKVAALLGEWSSTNTLPLATAMSPYSVVHCSSATTPLFSNKTEYPYFFRSVSSDIMAANSFATLAVNLGWKRVALLVSTLPYGLGLQKAFNIAAGVSGIQVISTQIYASGNTNFSSQFGAFQSVNARIFLLFGYDKEIPYILKEANSRGMWGPKFVYIGPNTSNTAFDTLFDPTLTITPEIIQQRALMDGLLINNANENVNTDIYSSLNARFLASTGKVPVTSNYFANDCLLGFIAGFNGLLANGVTMNQITSRTIPNFSLGSFLNVSFVSATGTANYDSNGERHGDFLFSSVINGSKVPVALAHMDASITYLYSGIIFAQNSTVVPSDSPAMNEISFNTSQAWVLVLVIILCVGAGSASVAIIVSLRFRNLESVKAISPNISLIIALGIVFSLLSTLSNVSARMTRKRCQASLYTSHLAITTVLAFIILKALRILKIFNNTPDRKRGMGDLILVGKGGAIVAVAAAILAIGDSLAPLQPTYVEIPGTMDYYYECRSSSYATLGTILGYELLLVVTAYFLAYKTRHAYEAYNESKYIRMAMQNILASRIIARFVEFILGDSAFLIKHYTQGFLFAYSDLFIFVVLIVRPLFRAIYGSTKDGFRAQSKPMAKSEQESRIKLTRTSIIPASKAGMNFSRKKVVVFMREEGKWFANWKTYQIFQNENGMYCTLLKNRGSDKKDLGDKGDGMFFSTGIYEIDLHETEANAITVRVDGRIFSVQFEEARDADTWISNVIARREAAEARAALRVRCASMNANRRPSMFQKSNELE